MAMPSFIQSARHHRWIVIAIAVLLLLGVVYVDWLTGPDFVMGEFYLLPVAMVTVLLGYRQGLVMAIVTVIIWGVAEVLGAAVYSHRAVAVLNGVMHLLYLVLVVWLLSVWRGMGERLEAQVQDRTAELVAEVKERKQAEEALHALALKLSDAEDAERRRLAHDIHDTIGQSLTLLKLRMQAAATTTTVPAQDAAAVQADEIQLLDAAIQQMRTLTFELHPPVLDDLGIIAALRWLAKELAKQASVDVTVTEEGNARPLPKPLASYLFRSVKELISNAISHGHSTEVVVTLYWRAQRVRATVDDNGSGFDPQRAQRGLGLSGIKERVATLGGSVSVESEPGKGTRVIIDVPLA